MFIYVAFIILTILLILHFINVLQKLKQKVSIFTYQIRKWNQPKLNRNFKLLLSSAFYHSIRVNTLSIVEKYLFVFLNSWIFCLAIITSPYIEHFPKSIVSPYIIISLVSLTIIQMQYTYYSIRNESGFNLLISSFLVIIPIIFIGLLYINVLSKSAELHFRHVLVAVASFMINVFMLMFCLLSSSKKKWLTILVTTFSIILSLSYMFLVFGIYNLTVEKSAVQLNSEEYIWLYIYRVIHYGTIYIFQLPDPSSEGSLVPVSQYLIAMLFNGLILSFIISYTTSLILESKQPIKQKRRTVNCKIARITTEKAQSI